MADGQYVKEPGLLISEEMLSTPAQQLIFSVQDVYGLPLNSVLVSINSETGYSYTQGIPRDMSDVVITLPQGLPDVQIKISRGGYHTLTADVALNQNVQRVDAVLEPQHKRVGPFVVETEGP